MKPRYRWSTAIVAIAVLAATATWVRADVLVNDRIALEISDTGDVTGIRILKYGEDLVLPIHEITKKGLEGNPRHGGLLFGLPFETKPFYAKERTARQFSALSRSASMVVTSTAKDNPRLPEGVSITRTYRLRPKSFVVELDLLIVNGKDSPISLNRREEGLYMLYLGPVASEGRNLVEVIYGLGQEVETESPGSFKIQELPLNASWVGLRNAYYALVLEETERQGRYVCTAAPIRDGSGKKNTGTYVGYMLNGASLGARAQVRMKFRLYLGTKTEKALADAGYPRVFNNWDGWTGPIGRMMFFLLKVFYGVTQNYGYAILLLTILVKLMLHPLNKKQMHAMRKMQELQPLLKEIQQKYKDQMKAQQEIQKLWKEHDVHPLGGCLPILIQIPIFIALYTCLGNAIELKNVAFWWLPDLAEADPKYILPFVFSASIYFSSQAASTDASQAAMMRIMPIFMFFIMCSISSGVMLYLAGQGVLGLVEQRVNQASMPTTLQKQESGKQEDGGSKKVRRKRKND